MKKNFGGLKKSCIFASETKRKDMAPKKKYHKTLKAARVALKETNPAFGMHIYKMPKGTRHHGEYAVCDEMEYLNTH